MKTTLGILFFSLICSTTFADSEKKGYPENFEWGAALSAHQTEGVAGGGDGGVSADAGAIVLRVPGSGEPALRDGPLQQGGCGSAQAHRPVGHG